MAKEKDKAATSNLSRKRSRGYYKRGHSMEDVEALGIEDAIIAIGSYLYNSNKTIADVDQEFLQALLVLVSVELERREATIH